ncbi:cytochrome C assembly family protein [Chitinibacteraceae bacterium HSL-7]
MTWLAFAAFLLYLLLGWHFCRTRLSVAAPARPHLEMAGMVAAFVLHALSLWLPLSQHPLHFGAAEALSMTAWLALFAFLAGQLTLKLDGLQPSLFAVISVMTAISLILPVGHVLDYPQSVWSRLHFLSALLAQGLLTNAAGLALLLWLADKQLHRVDAHALLRRLPPILSIERLLFGCAALAFALLSAALLTGLFFGEHIFGKALTLNHKTLFSIASWLALLTLLIGRAHAGWRGRTAVLWTWTSFGLLLLGYAGTRFVLDTLLR